MLNEIFSFISLAAKSFNAYAKDYPFIAGAVSLWGLSSLSYLMRNIPGRIWTTIKKQTTTNLSLMSSHQSYHHFLKWLSIHGYLKRIRSLKITSGRYGDHDKGLKSIGYGTHYFMHGLRPFKLEMNKVESPGSSMERDEIIMSILGRSHLFFNKIFEEINKIEKDTDKLSVYKYTSDYWRVIEGGQYKRSLNTIFLDEDTKKTVLGHITQFEKNEEWYLKNGVSYQTGILFYGKPGTGKTSFIKALASEFNKPLYILSASNLYKIENAILDLPEKAVLLIEDIDTETVTNKRKTDREKKESESRSGPPTIADRKKALKNQDDEENDEKIVFSFANLSDILNSIDGIISCHGRVLIATTNHKEKLSAALLRNGRFDLKINFDYASNHIVRQFFSNYYPTFVIPENFDIKNNIQHATIQTLILKNLENPDLVLKKLNAN